MKNNLFYIFAFISFFTYSQDSLEVLLKKYNDNSVPYITVEELAMPKTKAIILDSREPKEFKVSHLENAVCVGYDKFDIASIKKLYPNKNDKIVVYCSLGIRSETIGEKLKKAGYTNVYNLYGGIFEWKNKDKTIVDSQNNETNKVHTFNEAWSKWLLKGEKVFEVETSHSKKENQD